MGLSGAFFGCSGDVGFSGPLLGESSGVVGFNLAVLSRLGRDVFLPAWPGVCEREKVRPAWRKLCRNAKKFAQRRKNDHKLAFYGPLGEFFRGNAAGGAVLGEFCRGPAVVGSHRASCVAPLVFWAPDGPAAVCAGGRRPACEPSAPRASLGASTRSPATPRRRPRVPQPGPPAPAHRRRLVCRWTQWAGPGLVVDCYALSAADSSPVTSPCTLGW